MPKPRITAQTVVLRVTLTCDANLNLHEIRERIRCDLAAGDTENQGPHNSSKWQNVVIHILSRTTHYGDRAEPRGEGKP